MFYERGFITHCLKLVLEKYRHLKMSVCYAFMGTFVCKELTVLAKFCFQKLFHWVKMSLISKQRKLISVVIDTSIICMILSSCDWKMMLPGDGLVIHMSKGIIKERNLLGNSLFIETMTNILSTLGGKNRLSTLWETAWYLSWVIVI